MRIVVTLNDLSTSEVYVVLHFYVGRAGELCLITKEWKPGQGLAIPLPDITFAPNIWNNVRIVEGT